MIKKIEEARKGGTVSLLIISKFQEMKNLQPPIWSIRKEGKAADGRSRVSRWGYVIKVQRRVNDRESAVSF